MAGSVGQGDLLMMCGFVWLSLGAREISYDVMFGLAESEGQGDFLGFEVWFGCQWGPGRFLYTRLVWFG